MNLVETILSIQDELSEETKKLHIINNNKTQWNSIYVIINYAL